jgi:hypothetical protein
MSVPYRSDEEAARIRESHVADENAEILAALDAPPPPASTAQRTRHVALIALLFLPLVIMVVVLTWRALRP